MGELCKQVLKLPKWLLRQELLWGCLLRARCLVRKLCFLHKLTWELGTLCSWEPWELWTSFGSDLESTLLVQECSELEEWYGTSLAEALCSNDADHP